MITMPQSLREIKDEAFTGCDAMDGAEIVVPVTFEKMGEKVFLDTNITKITVKDYDE